MTEKEKVIAYAISQIGVCENPPGSNMQPYGAMLDTIPWYLYKDKNGKEWIHKVNGHDWCTQFHDAVFINTLGLDRAREILYRPVYNNLGAVVKYTYNYYKAAGRLRTKPEPGYSIFFTNAEGLSHIGIVIAVDGDMITTVEGNSGKNDQYVAKKTYNVSYNRIAGYGAPDYKAEPQPTPKEFEVGKMYRITCKEYLNVRIGAGIKYKAVGRLDPGAIVKCESVETETGYTWIGFNLFYICGKEGKEVYLSAI